MFGSWLGITHLIGQVGYIIAVMLTKSLGKKSASENPPKPADLGTEGVTPEPKGRAIIGLKANTGAIKTMFDAGGIVGFTDRNDLVQFLGVSPKTLERRLKDKTWSKAEQYKLGMLEHLSREATQVFGDEEKAVLWLNSPIPGLDNQAPIELLDTVEDYERAKTSLLRQAYGMF